MMDNLAANKSHLPCQSWVGQNGWSTNSTQGSLFNPLSSSQHPGLGSSSDQRPFCDHLQSSGISPLSSTCHSALYKASPNSSNSSSTTLFANTAIPSSSHSISFAQQSPHTSSVLLPANQGKNVPPSSSLPQTNQAPQPCRPQHLPLPSPHDPYNASFQPPLPNQSLSNRLQDLPMGLPSCGQHEQRQWIPSSHCKEAVKEYVSDSADHPNKVPLQEDNISPQASNERRRSVLLHQRAQLLQQLAELDGLLESIPPDDNSDGQSAHSAIQSTQLLDDSSQCEQTKTSDGQPVQQSAGESKAGLSAGCASPASFDEENETCETPEDPMSAADSERKENVSANSDDDSDPDYFPNSDGDFSDFLSDHERGSSDESSFSSPSTPERPFFPSKKGAKRGNSLIKANNVSPPKQTRSSCQKKPYETAVMPTSNSKAQRVYDRRNYCLFCSKPMSKMSRHLERVHSDKTEVAAAFQYPKKSKERQKIWNRLTNQGNFAHNKNVLKTGKGLLAVRKRPKRTGKAQDYLHCLYCRGLYMKKALFRHMRLCPEKASNGNESEIGRRRIASRCVLEASEDLGISDGLKSILYQMTYNSVTQTVMDDNVILQFGELLFDQHGSDVRKHDYIRQNLRQIARLVLEAQKITPMKKLEDFFLPESFPYVVTAVNILAGYNPENKTYRIPSLAIKLGYHLQKVCNIVEFNAVKSGDASLAESARNFLSEYQKNWNKLISAGALTALRETKLNTEKKVPFAQDVKRLNYYMENVHLPAEKHLKDSPTAENYAALVRVILARTILFNSRSAREVASVQLTDFMSRKKSNEHTGMDISDLERTMCGFFTRVDIQGKCGRMVPVFLKPSFVSAMELFVKVREACGVPSKNPYLFGRPNALSAYSGSDCIQKYVKACGARHPEALTSAKIRKHYASMLQQMNLDKNEADQIIGLSNQEGTLQQDGSMQLNDAEMDSDDGAAKDTNMTVSPSSTNSSKRGVQNQGKHKWEEAEVIAVERHLMYLIQGHKVPQKNDCIKCLQAEPEALKNRSWKGVKDYVRNRITALLRQTGTSKATSSTGHFQ